MSVDPELDIIQKAVAGEREAISQLLTRYHERLASHIRRKLPSHLEATVGVEDIQQRAYVQVFRDIANFVPESSESFFRWLRSIADHRLIEEIRKHKALKRGGAHRRVVEGEGTSGVHLIIDRVVGREETPSVCVSRKEAVRAVQIHLAGLPHEQRRIAELRWLEGKPLEEICQMTGKSEGAIRGMLYRTKKSLKDAIGEASLYLPKK